MLGQTRSSRHGDRRYTLKGEIKHLSHFWNPMSHTSGHAPEVSFVGACWVSVPLEGLTKG